MKMKFALCILAAGGLFLAGCSVEQSITVQNLNIAGAQSSVPLHVTNDSASALRAVIHFSPSSQTSLSAAFYDNVAPAEGQKGYGTTAGQMQWKLPSFEAGADLDFPLSHAVSLALGANTSGNHWGWNAGLGFHGQSGGAGVRLDAGFQWQSLSYDVDYLLMTTTTTLFHTTTDTQVVHKSESDSHGDFYAALTVNSTRPLGAVNFFIQFAYAHQTLYDIDRTVLVFPFFGWSDKTTISCSNFSMVPGLYLDLSPTVRLMAGARFMWPLGFDENEPTVLISPVVMFDVGW